MAIRKCDNNRPYGEYRKELGAFKGNCYGFIQAGINNNSSMLHFLKGSEIVHVLDGMEQSEPVEVLKDSVREKLVKLIKSGQEEKARKFFDAHYEDIFHYEKETELYFKNNNLRCAVIEFLSDKKESVHVAFVDRFLRIYDKDSVGQFNLGYDIKDLFKWWTFKGVKYFKYYALNEEQSKNVENYINNLISIKLNNPTQILV